MALIKNNKKELSIRKNITMPVETEQDLELLSKIIKPQSMIIRELIEEKSKEFKKMKKIEAFNKTTGIAANLIGNITTQQIKSQRNDV